MGTEEDSCGFNRRNGGGIQINALEKRIVDVSYRYRLSHISSCLNTVNLLAKIYELRHDGDPVILGNGHAGLALYVVLEAHGLCNAEEMVHKHGVHPHRDMENGIWCSSGSLGQAETVAVGLALADPKRRVWLVTSDGACAEGSVYEAMRIGKPLLNLIIYAVFNGFGAYGPIKQGDLPSGVFIHAVDQEQYPEFLRGLPGHYMTLNESQYAALMQ